LREDIWEKTGYLGTPYIFLYGDSKHPLGSSRLLGRIAGSFHHEGTKDHEAFVIFYFLLTIDYFFFFPR